MSADQNVSKLGVASVVLRAMLSASARLWISPFKGQKGAQNYFKDVAFALMRTQLGKTTVAQDQYMSSPLTTPAYIQFAKDKGFAPESITLSDGTQAHWIGNKTAQKLIVYFHGGGYVVPANAGQMQFLLEMKDTLIAQGTDTAVVLLAYTLAPEAHYPTQLKQAIELLHHLIEVENHDPSNITLGGDSAGGNLALGVLSHLSHPHEDIPALTLSSKLQAIFLISPWVSFNVHTPAFVTNAEKDCFDGRALSKWSSAFLNSDSPFAGDYYSEPLLAPASWWEQTPDVVGEVLIWGGGNEVLIDSIGELAKRLKKGFGVKGENVTYVVTPKAAHEEMIIERLLGYKGDSGTGSAKAVQDWVKAKL